jgi:hypothetical protein
MVAASDLKAQIGVANLAQFYGHGRSAREADKLLLARHIGRTKLGRTQHRGEQKARS